MKTEGYFKRVIAQSPTRFWINNPTREETDRAIKAGATGCTLNPSYTQKMLDNPQEGSYALGILDEVIREIKDDTHAIAEFQRRMAKPICEKFIPMFEASKGEIGYVSIQADPILESDYHVIVNEAQRNRKVSPNVCCKVPTTASGLKAMELLVPEGIPINATEIFAVQQGIEVGELYDSLVPRDKNGPKLWYSHIAGIYDEFIKGYIKENQIDIFPDLLFQGGLAVSRKLYNIAKNRGYRMRFIGGGARGTHHFTELVGGDVNITINWKGTADVLMESDPPVVWRMFNPVPAYVIKELSDKVPAFKQGYEEKGLNIGDFEEFGPVQLFRGDFIKSWKRVLEIIRQRRKFG